MHPVVIVLFVVAWSGLLRARSGPSARPIAVRPLTDESQDRSSTTGVPAIVGQASDHDQLGRRRRRPSWLVPIGLAIVTTAAAGPLIGGLVLAGPVLHRRRLRRRRERHEADAVIDQVPEVIDLLALALGAGLNVSDAVGAVARWAPGPVGDALGAAHRAIQRGDPAAVALESARNRCGPAAAGLFSALVAADRYGTPLLVALDRLGHDARLDRRRAAEERARRVPVQLLFPLVVCVLPAFGLLTVVPLLVNSLGTLS